MQTILVVDDEIKIRNMLRPALEKAGYRFLGAANGRDALFTARHEKPDLILLDLMMPEMSGAAFMPLFRREAETPVIMLTAKTTPQDELSGLQLGADDYIKKPFDMQLLLARIETVLRRAQGGQQSLRLRAGHIVMDVENRSVEIESQSVHLTPFEFELLRIFMASPERAFSRYDLLCGVSTDARESLERTIDVHIRSIRSKIEMGGRYPRQIQTVFGLGYRFIPSGI